MKLAVCPDCGQWHRLARRPRNRHVFRYHFTWTPPSGTDLRPCPGSDRPAAGEIRTILVPE